MSLARKVKRSKRKPTAEWFVKPAASEPPADPGPVEPERDEHEVRFACELVLLFALMHQPPTQEPLDSEWWLRCQKMSFSRPQGSYSSVFFWSMRTLGNTKSDLNDFRKYLDWKWDEFESGRIRREGPRWA